MRIITLFKPKKDWKKFALCLLSFILIAPFSMFGKVNLSNTPSESYWPAIAVNSAGEVMVVWTESAGGSMHYRIYKGGAWTNTRNSGIVRSYAWSNQLAVDSLGMFHWTCADGGGSYSRDIYYSYFTGKNWSNPELVYYSPYNSAWNKMDIASNDDIHVVWYHSHVPKGQTGSDVVYMKKRRMGSWPQRYENISGSRSVESIHPAIAVFKGNVYVCWMENASRRLYFREKVNGKWSSPMSIGGGYYPDMVVDSSGNIHIVFSFWGGNFYYISRIGGKWMPTEIISNGNAPLQFGEIQHKNNVIVATWIQGSNTNWSVYATGKIVGDKWQIPVKIANAPGGGDGNKHAQVALDNRNSAHFVWEGIGAGGKHDIFYEKYTVDTPKDATFIEVDNAYLSFYTDGSSNPSPQTFRIRASGAGSINYTISKDRSWTNVSPTKGESSGEWKTITVSIDSSGFKDGIYTGTITIKDPNAYNNPVDVGVSLTVGDVGGGGDNPLPSGTYIETNKTNMSFKMEEGTNPVAQAFNLRAKGGKSLNYTISSSVPWLDAFPDAGTATSAWASISVRVEAEDLKPGTFTGRIDIVSPQASKTKTSVLVNLVVEKKKVPSIQLSRKHIYFWSYAHGENPASDTFKVRNSGSKTLNFKIVPNTSWIKVNPSQGISTGEWRTLAVSVDNSSLGVARHKGVIKITGAGADNSPQTIDVEFEVEMPPQPYPPIDVRIRRLNHEGLIVLEYKSEITWKANPRNKGLFDIVKYKIFRKNINLAHSQWIQIDEVMPNVFTYYDGSFSSKEERNKYVYAVASVDSSGKESRVAPSIKILGQ